ncbi:MAG: integrase [Candidatus Azotimanducaceae bacterium]|jgi:integrase
MADGKDHNAEKATARLRGITLGEALTGFFSARELKPKTSYEYAGIMARSFGDWMEKPLRDITPLQMVKRFEEVTEKAGKASAMLSLRVFGSVWNYTKAATANNDGIPLLGGSPTGRISDLRKTYKSVRRQEHVQDFSKFFGGLASVQSGDFRDFVELLTRTGLRRSEASGLKWDDVDMKRRTFTARDTKNYKGHKLPTSVQVDAIFERLRQRHGGCKYIWGDSPMGDPRKSLAKLVAAYGEPFRLHDARRGFTNLIELCGVNWLKTKALLYHSVNGDVTAGYTVNADPERLRPEMQAISDKLDELAGLCHPGQKAQETLLRLK